MIIRVLIRGRQESELVRDTTAEARVWSDVRKNPQATEGRWPLALKKARKQPTNTFISDF